jgi:hypothetical protein
LRTETLGDGLAAKNVHHEVEAEMLQTIPMTLIADMHGGEHVDGVKFDVTSIFI